MKDIDDERNIREIADYYGKDTLTDVLECIKGESKKFMRFKVNLSGKYLRKKLGGIQRMSRFIIIGMVALGVILAGIACGDEGSLGKDGEVAATWIQAQVEDDTVSISVDEVNNNKIVHFYVPAESGEISFMAYDLNGNVHIRANICPPCRSTGFSLDNDVLVCDTCSTAFNANTGEGISGACVDYPKASVSYEINGGYLVTQEDDLVAAYQTSSQTNRE